VPRRVHEPAPRRLRVALERPEAFDPDRFLVRREDDKVPLSYVAFGGMHGCLGTQFGYLQVKAIVATLLRRFEITPWGRCRRPSYRGPWWWARPRAAP
jgi:cytochrome P450